METRKVQVTGKSTYIITLPKRWAVDSGLITGSSVSISYQNDGSLVIIPHIHDPGPRTKRLTFNEKIDVTMREIIGAYVMGYQVIEIHAAHISTDIKKEVKRICHNLIGIEVIEETESKIVIQDIFNAREFTMERGIKRMSSLVFLMFDGVINFLITKDDEIIREVISRDDEVDQTYLLVSKQFINWLNLGKNSVQKLNELSLIESFYYRQAAENIERIGDHIVKIVKIVSDTGIPDAVFPMKKYVSFSQDIVASSIESLQNSDASLANKVLARNNMEKKSLYNKSMSIDIPSYNILFDSFSRIGDYAANIAELTIDLS